MDPAPAKAEAQGGMIHPSSPYDPGLSEDSEEVGTDGEKQRAIPCCGMARIVLAVAYFPRPFARGVS